MKQSRVFYVILALIAIGGLVEKCERGDSSMPALEVRVITPENLAGVQLLGVALPIADDGSIPDEATLFESGISVVKHDWTRALVWRNLEPGRYLVGVCYALYYSHRVTKIIEVPTHGDVTETIQLPEPGGPEWLRVSVIDSDGQTVHNVELLVEHQLNSSSLDVHTDQSKERGGVRYVSMDDAAEVDGGVHTIEARSEEWGRVRMQFVPGTTEKIELQYGEPVRRHGVIQGYRGSGYERRIRVYVRRAADSVPDPRSYGELVSVDEEGRFVLPAMQPGEHANALVIYVRGTNPSPAAVASRPIEFRLGMKKLVVKLPKLYRLRVTGNLGADAVNLISAGDAPANPQWRTTAEGVETAEFDALPAGRYRLKTDHSETQVEIPKQSEVRFR